ncbi:MAG: HupE/UreJ family protein [Myxococcaceae bacterium]|nr:HupE/UreJ family protein [Myxococcaceae bacterium]MCA3016902.1 HupE/UreJ family protein [Myxococcaceae bacterium]
MSVACWRVAAVALALAGAPAQAHKGSDALWNLTAEGARLEGRLEVALADVELAVGLDADGDGAVTWGEVKAREGVVRPWLRRGLRVRQAEGPCTIELGDVFLTRHSDGVYGAWPFSARCPAEVRALGLDYALLFDVDAQHRGLVQVAGAGGGQWRAFSSARRHLEVELATPPPLEQLRVAFAEGVRHLAIGVDHLCFLLALLLPSVLRRQGAAWVPLPSLSGVLLEVTKVVSAFTAAHSVTLGLSAFGVLAPEARLVEVAIAASVLLAALNVVFPVVTEGRWVLAFGLGLLHGFGFVSALTDLGSGGGRLWLSLLGFNLGVEAGQLVAVALVVPLAFAVRHARWYARLALPAAGAALVALATWWTVERLAG